MSKIIRSCIIAFTIIFSTISISEINTKIAFADEQVSNGLRYEVNSDDATITIKGYVEGEDPDKIIIPSTIDGKTVTAIGDKAFQYFNHLSVIELPDTIKTIGNNAFIGCVNLQELVVPESVEQIGNSAFENCTNITSITIPKNVKTIGDCAFANCTLLKNITVDSTNENFSSKNGLLLDKSNESLLQVPSGLESISIPDNIKKIGEFAFSECNNLKSISIPESVEEIG